MTERDDLLLEHLRRFQTQMSRFEEMLGAVAAGMRSMKQHMAAFMMSEFNQDAGLASLKMRLERIEQRLDFVE